MLDAIEGLSALILLLAIVSGVALLIPLLAFWAINALFGVSIMLTVKTLAAFWVLFGILVLT